MENLSLDISSAQYSFSATAITNSADWVETRKQVAARVIADAFLHYPLMTYAFEGRTEQERALLLHKLYKKCVSAAQIYGGVITREDELGAAIWLPGEHFMLSTVKEILSGMALIPFAIGPKATLRLMNHESVSEGWIKKNARPDMGYIWNVGVSAEARRRGFCAVLIDQCIDQMRLMDIKECWLKTEDPINVTIYQKLGFTVMNHMVVKSSGVDSWAMRKMIS